MTPQQSYLEFAPPPTPGLLRGVLLALLAHGVLLAILTVSVQWKSEATLVTAEAELWSAIPQEAAPPAPQPEPPAPEPEPAPQKIAPPPPPAPPVPVVAPPQPDPSIAIAREKAKQRKERELLDKETKLQENQLAAKVAADKLEKAQAQKAKDLDAAKRAQVAKEAKAKAQAQASAADAKRLAEVRTAALKRMAALAAGSGNDNSQGNAAQSSGPSAGYGGRIRARIKPNITFTSSISGNPLAEVEVRTSPDGTIISRRLTKPSGVSSWDDAVLAAIDKTEVLPRDVDGRVPSALVISFRPRD